MWNSPEEAFKDLDSNEYNFFARALGAYQKSLMKEGFTRREATRLVETYSKFIYEMSLEEFMSQKRMAEDMAMNELEADDDDDIDVDSDGDDQLQ